jgi:hypothetical protein
MKFQLAGGAARRLKTPLYFCACGEIGPHIPPDQGQAGRNYETFFQFADDGGIVVGAQKTNRERQPLPVRNSSHHIEQVIGVTGGRRQRFLVSNLKIFVESLKINSITERCDAIGG